MTSVFETLEQSVELYKKGVQSNTEFVYVWDCEETTFDDFDIKGDISSQLASLHNSHARIEICKDGNDIFSEFTRTICPAYSKGTFNKEKSNG